MTAEFSSRIDTAGRIFRLGTASLAIVARSQRVQDSRTRNAISPCKSRRREARDRKTFSASVVLESFWSASFLKARSLAISSTQTAKSFGHRTRRMREHDLASTHTLRSIHYAPDLFGKMKKAFVDCLCGENMATVSCAGRDKINRRSYVDPSKAMESRRSIFGGHRPPLQVISQSGEKLLMDIVEAAIAEHHDHVFWPEHRNNSVHNCVRILLVERRPAGLSDRRNDSLRF